ncbi:MAG: T9SS type A sorting domain-containing protein, partial [Candidatus Heimdallarchaeota archaeon]|nr:T9SS type A sorting domain-containing protein [Candidatus Heimdallarchaeota archaeon]
YDLKVYPNPFDSYTMVEIPHSDLDTRVEIIDIYGRRLRSMEVSSTTLVRIERNDLPGGVYFLIIHSENVTYSQRVIIR